MTTTRSCPQCGQAVEGRADKFFCSTICRAQHFRDQQAQPEAVDDDDAAYTDYEDVAEMEAGAPVAFAGPALLPARAAEPA